MRGVGIGEGVTGQFRAGLRDCCQYFGQFNDEDCVPAGGYFVVAGVEFQKIAQMGEIFGGFFPLPRGRVYSTTVIPAPTATLVSPETVITFPDKNLELSIRSASVGGWAGW